MDKREAERARLVEACTFDVTDVSDEESRTPFVAPDFDSMSARSRGAFFGPSEIHECSSTTIESGVLDIDRMSARSRGAFFGPSEIEDDPTASTDTSGFKLYTDLPAKFRKSKTARFGGHHTANPYLSGLSSAARTRRAMAISSLRPPTMRALYDPMAAGSSAMAGSSSMLSRHHTANPYLAGSSSVASRTRARAMSTLTPPTMSTPYNPMAVGSSAMAGSSSMLGRHHTASPYLSGLSSAVSTRRARAITTRSSRVEHRTHPYPPVAGRTRARALTLMPTLPPTMPLAPVYSPAAGRTRTRALSTLMPTFPPTMPPASTATSDSDTEME